MNTDAHSHHFRRKAALPIFVQYSSNIDKGQGSPLVKGLRVKGYWVDLTWYSCPGPVLARIISLPLQCSTWYRRPGWRR